MKKFFSLLCAVAIALSASAVPSKANALKTRTTLETAKVMKNAKKSPFVGQVAEKQAFEFTKKEAATAKRAPQAKQEAVNVTIGEADWTYSPEDGDVFFILTSDDESYVFAFDILVAEGDSDIVLGKTYYLSDMVEDYTYGADYVNYEYLYFDSVAFVKTEANGLAHIEAYVETTDGDIFNLLYQEELFVLTGDTVTYAVNAPADMEYSSYYEDWTITADDGVYGFALDIISDDATSALGTYASADFALGYTYVKVYDNGTATKVYAHDAAATIAAVGDTTVIAATIIGEDGVVYELSAKYAAPTVQGEATITATNLDIVDTYISWGFVWAEASNADYAVYVSFSLDDEATSVAGTYTIGDDASGDVTIFAQDSAVVDFYSGTVTLAQTEAGWALTGTVLAKNNIEYTLNLTYVKPTKTREETITIDGLALNTYTSAWQISGYNADSTKFVSIAAYADAVAGTYTEADLAASYSYVVTDISAAGYKMFNLVEANLTVTYDEAAGTATVTGTFLGQNGDDVPLFTLNLTAGTPEPSPYLDYDTKDEAFKEVFDTYEVSDKYLASYGDLIVTASNENGARVGLDFYVAEGDSVLTPGVYTINTTEEPMTLYTGSCDGSSVYYSFVGYTDEEGYIASMWFPVDGTVTVHENGVIEIVAVNSYGAQIECRLGVWAEAIENTNINATATKTVRNGQLIILKNGNEYNAQGAILK